MKSRTSFFNGPVFRKNLTRFAPLWGGYTICLLLGMLMMMQSSMEYWFAAHLAQMCSGMGIVNFGYALLTAQVLFGDLWSSRMCNALHALPLKRECWFHTHVASGLMFSLLPTAVMSAAAVPVLTVWSVVENSWQIPLYFFLASNLEYLCFFGIAALCVMCSGSRVGMAVLYTLVNFLSYLVYCLVSTLITPMYYGAVTPMEPFAMLCPVVKIGQLQLVECQLHRTAAGVSMAGAELVDIYGTFHMEEGWTYLAGAAAAGVAMLVLAKVLYRRRRLECAGDFLSTRKLDPVFMVLFSVTAGTVFHFIQMLFLGTRDNNPVFLLIGLVVGWFAGRMLLERQTQVFGKLKNWLGLLALVAGVTAVLYGASLDPFGVEDWVPDVQEIKSVQMISGHRGVVETTDPEEIADVIRIQRGILEEKLTDDVAATDEQRAHAVAAQTQEVLSGKVSALDMVEKIGYRKYVPIDMIYTLKNGWTVTREYWAWADSEPARLAKPYFNRVGAIFYHYNDIRDAEDLRAMTVKPRYLYADGVEIPDKMLSRQMTADMIDAILADCEAGTMVQTDDYHDGFVVDADGRLRRYYRLDIQLGDDLLYFTIYSDSENCLKWMEDYGLRQLIDDRIGVDSK